MTEKIINCSKCSCSHFINEFAPIKAGIASYMLCPRCVKELLAHLEGKHFVATMIKTTMGISEWEDVRDERKMKVGGWPDDMSVAEWRIIRDERRMAYAGGDFGFGWGE